jgi:hypothetical protein
MRIAFKAEGDSLRDAENAIAVSSGTHYGSRVFVPQKLQTALNPASEAGVRWFRQAKITEFRAAVG